MKTIKITQGFTVTVDDKDFERLSQFKWHALVDKNTTYAVRTIRVSKNRRTSLLMHREIVGCGPEKQVDHKDGNGLNNCRNNLRMATEAQNSHNARRKRNNRAGLKGVNQRPNGKFRARIWLNGKNVALGEFFSGEEAHAAYQMAAQKNFNAFARFQ